TRHRVLPHTGISRKNPPVSSRRLPAQEPASESCQVCRRSRQEWSRRTSRVADYSEQIPNYTWSGPTSQILRKEIQRAPAVPGRRRSAKKADEPLLVRR